MLRPEGGSLSNARTLENRVTVTATLALCRPAHLKTQNSLLFVTISMSWCMNGAPLLRRPECAIHAGLLTLLLPVDACLEQRLVEIFSSWHKMLEMSSVSLYVFFPHLFFFLPTPQTLPSFCALLYRSSCLYPPTSYLSFCSYFVQSYPPPPPHTFYPLPVWNPPFSLLSLRFLFCLDFCVPSYLLSI